MDTQGTIGRESQERRLPRILTLAALVCFALPFLTVTCYGESTVSGVQAATGIDIHPNDDASEKELVREEPMNAFASVALVAAIASVALAFGSARWRPAMVWTASIGVFALAGLFVYAFYRSWGGAWPRIGFVGALMLLVGAAWAGVERVPRWVVWAITSFSASMIPAAVISIEGLDTHPWLFTPIYAGGFIAPALAVWAVRASVRPSVGSESVSQPSTLRLVVAGIAGLACLAAAAVGSAFLMGVVLGGQLAPDDVASSYAVAIAVLTITVAASVVAWIAGRAIVHGRREMTSEHARAEVMV
jgi:hypothetical protein